MPDAEQASTIRLRSTPAPPAPTSSRPYARRSGAWKTRTTTRWGVPVSSGCEVCQAADAFGTLRCEAGQTLYDDWRQSVVDHGRAYGMHNVALTCRSRYVSLESVEREIERTKVLKDRAYKRRLEARKEWLRHLNEKSPATAAHG